MKIMICGASGQLGYELCEMLRRRKCDLGDLPESLYPLDLLSYKREQLDVTSLPDCIDKIHSEQPSVVINCAAITSADVSETMPDEVSRINSIGARNLAIATEGISAKLVHISSDYVFGQEQQRTLPYKEWDSCGPVNYYGHSKVLSETYVQSFSSRYFIIRTAWLYGKQGRNFVRTMLRLAKEKSEIRVVSDQIGNPTYAEDVAYHILKLITTNEYGIYHCTNNGECSWFEFAKAIMEIYGMECSVKPCTTEEFHPIAPRAAYSSLDNAMLRITIGDNMRDWKKALQSFISFIKEQEE